MTAATNIEVRWEAQGSTPHYRYDHIQPLLQGRVKLDGVNFLRDDPMVQAGFFENARFKDGDFGILDTNWGDSIPAIANAWDLRLLPVFIKRKPAYNYLWVRSDRGIELPKDLEGKMIATGGYGSAITTYTRGFLKQFYGVDLSRLRWLSTGQGRFEIYAQGIEIEYATGPRKSQVDRLLEGEVDACTGDITDSKAWAALYASNNVKPMFPNYQELNRRLFRENGIVTPVHVLTIGGRLMREQPGLGRRIFDAFERSREVAIDDALGDGSGYSMIVHMREDFQDQIRDWGDVWKDGLSANRETVNTFLDLNFEHGLTKTRLAVEDVFAPGTLDT